jgi:ATP-dependent Clp protease adaptor protein ClpS
MQSTTEQPTDVPVKTKEPQTDPTTTIVTKDDKKVRHIPLYKVLLHNDDVNSCEHVVYVLMNIFGFTVEEANMIMLEAHEKRVALCKVEPLETAELHRDQLQSFSLTATIEPAD